MAVRTSAGKSSSKASTHSLKAMRTDVQRQRPLWYVLHAEAYSTTALVFYWYCAVVVLLAVTNAYVLITRWAVVEYVEMTSSPTS